MHAIPKHRLQIIDYTDDYKTAITKAAQPLLKDGYITEAYIDEMIDALEEFGPYIVLADEFALPHARPSESVKKTGLALLVIKDGVDVLGEKVHVMIVLAAKDKTAHLEMLQSLSEFLMEKQNIQDIKACSKVEDIDKLLEKRWQ